MSETAIPQAQTETAIPQAQAADITAEMQDEKEITPEPAKIKVKYNHEEKEIPLEEAITLAQKGMNYDKVLNQLEELKNDEALKIADKLASQYGVSRAELLKKWEVDISQREIAECAEKNDIPPEVAEKLLEAERIKKEREAEKQTKADEDKRKKTMDEQEKVFREAYPDVKDADIPDEVLHLWLNGTDLTTAYRAYESSSLKKRLIEMEKEIAALKTNEENAETSMGSAQTQGDAKPFKVTKEWIRNAAPQEYEKHRHEILEAYKQGKIT